MIVKRFYGFLTKTIHKLTRSDRGYAPPSTNLFCEKMDRDILGPNILDYRDGPRTPAYVESELVESLAEKSQRAIERVNNDCFNEWLVKRAEEIVKEDEGKSIKRKSFEEDFFEE